VVVVAAGRAHHAQGDRVARPYSQVELQQAANYLNQEFKGRTIGEVRQAVLDRLREEADAL
jgi:transcriptional regulator of heat shock response